MVKGGDLYQKVVSSNPSARYWMDIFSYLFVARIVMFYEKTKLNKKEVGVGPFTKKLHHGALFARIW